MISSPSLYNLYCFDEYSAAWTHLDQEEEIKDCGITVEDCRSEETGLVAAEILIFGKMTGAEERKRCEEERVLKVRWRRSARRAMFSSGPT